MSHIHSQAHPFLTAFISYCSCFSVKVSEDDVTKVTSLYSKEPGKRQPFC